MPPTSSRCAERPLPPDADGWEMVAADKKSIREEEREAAEGRAAKEIIVAVPGLTAASLDAALRLTAHEHHKIGILARLYAGALIGDDERGARQHDVRDAVD